MENFTHTLKVGPQCGCVSPGTRPKRPKVLHTKSGIRPAKAAGMENSTGSKMTQSGRALFTRKLLVVSDVLCLILVSIPFFVSELKMVRPYSRGIECGDTSITYPYKPSETVSDTLLIVGGILITGISITLGEWYRVRYLGVRSKGFVKTKYVSCLYKEWGSFLFGCSISQSLTSVAKLSVGRLRPHFLSLCGVTYESLSCKSGTYLATVKCPNADPSKMEEARKSFFSGHASFAMYTMLYLVFYLQARLTWREARLLRPVLQFFLFLLAVYTGLTRITDNKHHPSDVLFGHILGGLTAYLVAFYISSMFKRPSLNQSQVETQDNHLQHTATAAKFHLHHPAQPGAESTSVETV
ncbi:phospholipid phosphatase 3-like isoform X2 [Corythoichthys intestinalis]|uniref:phospholipid phosphatase 3-like isoform X2 n=1 Tax=Corythoichthys intestinalis TaxID=161448 RepID=UPI0025A520E7|nr:phospholipid phosphatase 3-like isoform X2 [Corythoichthys intestinalis]